MVSNRGNPASPELSLQGRCPRHTPCEAKPAKQPGGPQRLDGCQVWLRHAQQPIRLGLLGSQSAKLLRQAKPVGQVARLPGPAWCGFAPPGSLACLRQNGLACFAEASQAASQASAWAKQLDGFAFAWSARCGFATPNCLACLRQFGLLRRSFARLARRPG